MQAPSVETAPRHVWVGLGANLGNAARTLHEALQHLATWANQNSAGDPGFRSASLYRSESLGASGPDYLNTVARFASPLPAITLLEKLLAIEFDFGRTRPYRNAPRVLDLDLLLAGDEHFNTPRLTLPHPRMLERAFVLMPMAELEPGLILAGKPIATHLQACQAQRCMRLAD